MERICKAMTAVDRILSAVTSIKDIKDRKGIASDDAVRAILSKWWIPSNSKIANALKWYSHDTVSDNDKSVIDIANVLVEHSVMVNNCHNWEIIYEVPSNGFKLPGGAGCILNETLWFSDNGVLKSGKVTQIGLNTCNEYYDILIALEGDSRKFINLPECKVFLNRVDLELAVKSKFI